MPAVVILAGGEGRRIGGSKPQQLLADISLLDRAIHQACGWSGLVAIASRQQSVENSYQNIPVLADDSDRGPIAGVEAALRFAREHGVDRVLTIACDTPFLPVDLCDRLGGALTGSAGTALAASGGRLHPTCGMWRASCLDDVPAYLASGRASVHGFAETIGAIAVEWSVEPVDPFFNINRAADLAKAEAILKSR